MTDLLILCRSLGRRTSSAALAEGLRERGLRVRRATVRPQRVPVRGIRTALSYGVSAWPSWYSTTDFTWITSPHAVHTSANKLHTFQALQRAEVPTLEFTTHADEARAWIEQEHTVVARTILRGSRGAGIVLSPPDPLPQARLYTKLFRGRNVREYRVYIVGAEAVDITQKRRWSRARREEAGLDHNNLYHGRIRSHHNGWVFCRNTIDVPAAALEELKDLAAECARVCRIGFGAVDVIATHTDSGELIDARVVEPNTAPGLVGDTTTRDIMADALAAYIRR